MEQAIAGVPITEKELRKYLSDAQTFIETTRWRVPIKQKGVGTYVSGDQTQIKEISLTRLMQAIDSDDELYTHIQLRVLRAIRRGIQIGYHVENDYRKRSGIYDIDDTIDLHPDQLKEYNEKMQTAAVIVQFCAIRYMLFELNDLVTDNAFINAKTLSITVEVNASRPTRSLQCLIYCLGKNIERSMDASDEKLVAIVYRYAEKMQQAILNRTGSLKYIEFFADITYQLEETDFSISGFALVDIIGTTSIEFNRLEFRQIVGNRDAKHFMRMDAKRRVCYDFKEQKNPFLELGGVSPIVMGYGKPGTGKSMLIAAYATLLHDLCEALNIPFFFHPLPDNIVDSFQGNSAKNMLNWMLPLQDPTRITWAPIDDAENILENRTHQGVSEGVKAAIGVFLRYTEGAYAINRGNSIIGIFTNIPENIDPAVLSRIQSRFAINGAETREDFLDQDNLWWQKLEESEPGFVNMKDPKDYEWQSTQDLIESFTEVSQDLNHPSEPKIREAFYSVVDEYGLESHEFFAQYYMAVMKLFPLFSSRDMRNIQSAVNMRIMDFDLPDEWFEHPDIFITKEYQIKMDMILELRKANMKGLSFAEIRLQETNRYLDNVARIADAEFQRAVEEGVRRQRIQQSVMQAVGAQR